VTARGVSCSHLAHYAVLVMRAEKIRIIHNLLKRD